MLEHLVRHLGGHHSVPEHHGDDRVFAGQEFEAFLGHPAAEQPGVLEQPGPQFAGILHQVQRLDGGGDDRGGQGVGEQVRAGFLAEHGHHFAAAGHVASGRAAQRLAEGAGVDVHTVGHPRVLRGSGPGGTHKADGVGIVHHHQGVVLLGEVADGFQRRQVAVHGEHTVGDDDPAPGILRLNEPGLELRHVLVGVAEPLGLAEPDAVDDGGVVESVGDDGVLGAEEGFEDAAVGIKATREQDGVLCAEEPGNPGFQFQVQVLGAADEADAGHAEATRVHG